MYLADIYSQQCHIYVYLAEIYVADRDLADIHIYISEGLRPLPPAPRLEDPMMGRFDDAMDG